MTKVEKNKNLKAEKIYHCIQDARDIITKRLNNINSKYPNKKRISIPAQTSDVERILCIFEQILDIEYSE